MKLRTLVQDLGDARVIGDAEVEVRDVRADSRKVTSGDVFVAVRGMTSDGHQFVDQAVAAGAAAIVVETEQDVAVPQVVVASGADALGAMAARALGRPGDRMQLIGITGTNGKTTTSFLVEAMLEAAGTRPGVIGTVSYRYGGRDYPAPYTTPTPLVLHRVFRDMVDAGTTHGLLEVSSAALSMDRMAWVEFEVAAFTNLTQDHLDVHGGMDAYRDAKARLFADYLSPGGVCVVNVDDPIGAHMASVSRAKRVLRVSVTEPPAADADVFPLSAESTIGGIKTVLSTPRGPLEVGSTRLIGQYNIANLALAVAIGEALELPHEAMSRGIAEMDGVPGRVQRVANDRELDILVDYAHTPDALVNVLGALRPLTRRRLICVFGCGGDRDPSKRPIMGAAVASGADLAVVTSDNPRTEQPQSIIDMILPAVPDPFFVDVDRRTAIRAAIAEATPGDIVLIAGKGHEDYQILGTEKIHFDDREEAAAAAAARQTFQAVEVVEHTDSQIEAGDLGARFSRVIIDGRIAAPGDLYVAIRGERFDGHAFCGQAIAAGATGVVVESAAASDPTLGRATVISAEDPRLVLGQIAGLARRRWARETEAQTKAQEGRKWLVGVTGSAGKTTTKALIAAALGAAGRTHASKGSLNNETGVPLSLLGLRPFHDFGVVEMGMRAVGQIDYLVDFAAPDVGVVVNAGTAHVGVVGSAEAIAAGKAEMFGRLPAYGCAVLPAGDQRLARGAANAPRRLTFGEESDADVRLVSYQPAGAAGADLVVEAAGARHSFRLPLVGRHNAINACCALAAVLACGVDPTIAVVGLEGARPAPKRGVVTRVGERNVLDDCYNANPASMRAAMTTLVELAGEARAVAVLGDMLELGPEAEQAHRDLGRLAGESDVHVIVMGEWRDAVCAGAQAAGGTAVAISSPEAAAAAALDKTKAGDWILIKASRGMQLERVIEFMRAERERVVT